MILKKSRTLSFKIRCLSALVLLALFMATSVPLTAQELDAATTKLFLAVQKNDQGLARVALKEGGDLYAYNDRGRTAVDLAIDAGYFYLVQFLLKERDKLDESGLSKPVKAYKKTKKIMPKQIVKAKSVVKPVTKSKAKPPAKPKLLAQKSAKPFKVPAPVPAPSKARDLSEISKPPAYPPSSPKPIVKKYVAPKPVPEPPVIAEAPVEVAPVKIVLESPFKPIEIVPVEAQLETIAALPKLQVEQVPEFEPEVLSKPEFIFEPEPAPIDEPLPIVTFVPNTKSKLSPVRTFFFKTMVVRVEKKLVPAKVKKTITVRPKRKVLSKKDKIQWGSVKPAETVVQAPDFPTPPRRLTKTRVDAVTVDPTQQPITCEDYSSSDNVENTSSSLTLGLPPLRADVKCDP